MKDSSMKFLEFLPNNLINQCYEKTYLPEETISYQDEETSFFILDGKVGGIRSHNDNVVYFPKIFTREDFCGFYSYVMEHPAYWEFISLTECKVLIIPKRVIKEVILKDINIYRKLVNLQSLVWEYGIKFFYLQALRGNQAAYAFFLLSNSVEGELHYIKHERLSHMLNISRASFHLIEKEFIQEGLIKKSHKKIIILDVDGLKKYFEEFTSM